MVILYQTQASWSREERNRINENWQRITEGFSGIQRQINILAGGEEVDELLARIQQALQAAETGVQEYINQVEGTLDQAIEANNTATQDAINANNTALQTSLETVAQTLQELNGAISAAGTATTDATSAKDATIQATEDALKAINEMQSLINNFGPRGAWSSTTQYFKNNLAEDGGRTYIALKENINTPVTDKNTWALFADKGAKGDPGEKGDPGAGLNIIGSLGNPSELPETGSEGDAYTIDGHLWIWNGTAWEDIGNIRGEQGLSAYEVAVNEGFIGTVDEWLASLEGPQGPAGPPGPPGQDANTTAIEETLDEHIRNKDIHVTSEEKEQWNRQYKLVTSGGTKNAFTLPITELFDGLMITFIAGVSNLAETTTINGKPLVNPSNISVPPHLIQGRAYTVWYSTTNVNYPDGAFFIKASATGTATAGNVLAGKTFSNDSGTGIVGNMNNYSGSTFTFSWTNDSKGDTVKLNHGIFGFVDGSKTSIQVRDTNLIPANIVSGKSIFGVDGTAQTGVGYATGTASATSSTISFPNTTGTVSAAYYYIAIDFATLGFTPKLVRVRPQTMSTSNRNVSMWTSDYMYYASASEFANVMFGNSLLRQYKVNQICYLPVQNYNTPHIWEAWG